MSELFLNTLSARSNLTLEINGSPHKKVHDTIHDFLSFLLKRIGNYYAIYVYFVHRPRANVHWGFFVSNFTTSCSSTSHNAVYIIPFRITVSVS